MSKAKVIVLSVIEQGLTKAETARKYDVSWRWVHTLVQRYEQHGLHGLEPRSTAPRSNSRATPQPVKTRILELRTELQDAGLDNGPVTIAWHLEHESLTPVPAISTIRRIITGAGLVTPAPRKRPKSSLRRFQAEQPNETWQSDSRPLAPRRWQQHRNPELARRPLQIPAVLHRPRPCDRQTRR